MYTHSKKKCSLKLIFLIYFFQIRIQIQAQDVYTHTSDSYIYIEGKFTSTDKDAKLVTNPWPFLFSEVKYLLAGVEIDNCRDVGYVSLLKGLASNNTADMNELQVAGWHSKDQLLSKNDGNICACIPLRNLLGFAEDYKKVIINTKQELVLFRSGTDNNLFIGKNGSFELKKIIWKLAHVVVSDPIKLNMLKKIHKPIQIAFRSYELHIQPSLKSTNVDYWSVRTSTQLEKPRFMIIGLQTDRHDKMEKDNCKFDAATIRNIKLFLNSESYPYDKQNLNFSTGHYALAYKDYADFQSKFYGRANDPMMSIDTYKENPIFILDSSKQIETIKEGAVDIHLELESNSVFPANTNVYCLIIHDTLVEYNPLDGTVHRYI